MSLKINSKAPDFKLKDQDGQSFHLTTALKNGPILLFFYPKAFTPGCTAEVCSFREDYSFFSDRNIQLIGISHDTEETQKKFKEKYHLPYPLLSDTNRKVAKLYDAVYPFGLMTKRTSYFINQEGIISDTIDQLMGSEDHIRHFKQTLLRAEQKI
jgi:peroxiredoxin Q/BCP